METASRRDQKHEIGADPGPSPIRNPVSLLPSLLTLPAFLGLLSFALSPQLSSQYVTDRAPVGLSGRLAGEHWPANKESDGCSPESPGTPHTLLRSCGKRGDEEGLSSHLEQTPFPRALTLLCLKGTRGRQGPGSSHGCYNPQILGLGSRENSRARSVSVNLLPHSILR